jgi:pimeloyl-ACP methyl ester carboxylesterase
MRNRLLIRDLAIEVREWPGAQPPFVLLHEGLGFVAEWRDFPAQLAATAGRTVFAYSRLGHGDSDRPPSPHTTRFMHEEAETWLPAILDAAGIGRSVLLGHSDGGSIALIFAALFPARVASLVLEAPHVFVEDISIASIEAATARYRTGDLRTRLAKYHRDADSAFAGWSDVWLDPEFRAWNIEEYLARVTCPVFVIQGRQDEYGTLAQVQAIAAQVAGPVETMVLPNCGHSPHRGQPDIVLDAITKFVGGQESRSTAG